MCQYNRKALTCTHTHTFSMRVSTMGGKTLPSHNMRTKTENAGMIQFQKFKIQTFLYFTNSVFYFHLFANVSWVMEIMSQPENTNNQKIFYFFLRIGAILNDIVRMSLFLTLRAVVSLPALQAESVALLVAGVVTKRVVSGSAVVRASLPEVVLVAEDVVGITQLALLAKVHVLRPVLADCQSPLGRQTADEVVLVV